MIIKSDYVIFSTGKEVYANRGIIGLSPKDEGGWEVSEGYDGGIDHEKLTKNECTELADFMIALWQQFKSEI